MRQDRPVALVAEPVAEARRRERRALLVIRNVNWFAAPMPAPAQLRVNRDHQRSAGLFLPHRDGVVVTCCQPIRTTSERRCAVYSSNANASRAASLFRVAARTARFVFATSYESPRLAAVLFDRRPRVACRSCHADGVASNHSQHLEQIVRRFRRVGLRADDVLDMGDAKTLHRLAAVRGAGTSR